MAKRHLKGYEMSDLTLVRFLPPHIEFLRENLMRHIKENRLGYRILFSVPLSAFVDSDRFKSRPNWADTYLGGVIEVAIISDDFKGILLGAIFDSFSRHLDQKEKKVIRELDALGIHLFVGNTALINEKEFLLECRSSSFSSIKASRQVVNISEYWLYRRLCEGLLLNPKFRPGTSEKLKTALFEIKERQNSKFRVYSEVSLGSLLRKDAASRNPELRRLIEDLERFPCDLLVATAPPSSMPLLVVEYDGFHHNDEGQREKDIRRDKKLARAGLPVLRVSSGDFKKLGRRGYDSADIANNENLYWFEYFIGQIIYYLCEWRLEEIRCDDRLSYIFETEIDLKIKDMQSEGRIGSFSDKDIEDIFDEFYSSEKRFDVLSDFSSAYEKMQRDFQFTRHIISKNGFSFLKSERCMRESFTYYKGCFLGPNGKGFEVVTPELFLSFSGSDIAGPWGDGLDGLLQKIAELVLCSKVMRM